MGVHSTGDHYEAGVVEVINILKLSSTHFGNALDDGLRPFGDLAFKPKLKPVARRKGSEPRPRVAIRVLKVGVMTPSAGVKNVQRLSFAKAMHDIEGVVSDNGPYGL